MAPTQTPTLLWGGRFTEAIDDLMFQFNESLSFDKVLYKADIHGSITYAKALHKLNILTDEELSEIVGGLQQVEKEWAEGKFVIDVKSDEDIHTANERRLGEIIGKAAGKLHTGRSRNEQVGVDMRLWAGEQLDQLAAILKDVLATTAAQAKEYLPVLMPGYTHLQRAQPVRFSHWLLSHATFLIGDLNRLKGVQERTSACPLGVGALAGNPFGIDREFMAKDLGFVSVHPNSLACVADRDFVVDILQWASLLMAHLSRLSEDLILFSTAEFGFVQSSGFLSALKSLPTSYNKDLQESVEPMIDCIKTVSTCLRIMQGVLATLKVYPEKMKAALTDDMLATDVADYLVRKGVPFRQTHHIAGAIVRRGEEAGVAISKLPLEDFKQISPLFEADVADVFDFEKSVERRNTYGGTSSSSVLAQIEAIEKLVQQQ
ncbi:L-Aspartase-like protein [Apiosordaria backusii]|uniref:argininosuccinate lyase n=1 Tax=Apiosordaria backusii TaxID=314023 RepID=A0AA39ZS41_9PEZI|nr:L-Aspartase-like protein [Apiosordaria backusii]